MGATLSEADSSAFLVRFGVPFAPHALVHDATSAAAAADRIGYPVVVKLCGDAIAHKTERGLVRLRLADAGAVTSAAAELLAAAGPEDGPVAVLVASMVSGARELIAGLSRDAQFGMTVMVGIGGVLTEALGDVAVRLVPIERADAADMLDSLQAGSLMGPVRGEPAVDREAMVDLLMALSDAGVAHPELVSADVNPVVIVDGRPVAVDALVELEVRDPADSTTGVA